MTDVTPTKEQLDVISTLRSSTSNILINALAGTGKTTTLDLIQAASPVQPVLCLAFNKSVADEAAKRFPSTTTVRTFNGLGHRVWAKSVSKLTLDPKKTQILLKAAIAELKGEDRREASEGYWEVYSAVALAKALGYIPNNTFPQAKRLITREAFHATLEEKPTPFLAAFIDHILTESTKASYSGLIDFNDQIYMPALFGGTFPRFPLVLIDEAQDLSPTNHEMLNRLCRGRVCAVGDPWQSIYGFRGAVAGGMGKLRDRYAMQEKTISYSFRCPQKVVENAHWRVPEFKWIKEGGLVEVLPSLRPDRIPHGAAILCRNNAPLFRCAFGLLSAKRSVQVAGSDIGPKLVGIIRKLGGEDTPRSELLGRITEWKAKKLSASNSPASVADMAECMKVFASFGSTLGQAVAYAEHLFKQQGTIKLLTGHKAKGGEWNTVYHLDPWLIGDDEQELNLRYVIQTRAAEKYFEIDWGRIQW